MSETRNWYCPNCEGNPLFEHEAMMKHLLEVHGIDPKVTKCERKLLMHAKHTNGSSYQFEWLANGLKFIQNVTHLRGQDRTPAPKPMAATQGRLSTPQPPNCLSDDDWMPFGKHGQRGADPRRMKDVPPGYLDWLSGQDWLVRWPKVMNYIEWRRKALDLEMERKQRT